MPQFKYIALSRDGVRVTGVMEGYNELDAAARVKESCDVILKLTEMKEGGFNLLTMEIGKPKLNVKAFTVLCSQFAIILNSGIPIARAVKLVAEKTTDKPLRRVMDKVSHDVEGGRSLSAAFSDHGEQLLPLTFVETLRAGEATGNVSRSFESMHDHFEKDSRLRAKVRGALAYPVFVLTIAVVVVMVLMVKVVPVFTSMFDQLGGSLPLPTQILIAISDFFRAYVLLIVGIAAGIVLAVRLYGGTEQGKLKLARYRLKLPVLGKIEELGAASQFSNTMAAMIGAGLTVNRAVAITARVVSNAYLSQQTADLTTLLESGRSLASAMREKTEYPDILIDMAGVGENSGELEKTLGTIANYYDTELEDATKAALSKLEPALLIGLALVAGFIVIAVYAAMFSMYGMMNNGL